MTPSRPSSRQRIAVGLAGFREHVAPIFAVSFLFGLSLICLSVGGYTVFVDELGAGRIPQLLIASAALSVLLGFADLRMSATLALRQRAAVIGVLMTSIAITLGVLARWFPSPAVTFILPLGFEVILVFSEMIVVALAINRYSMREAKRYFGMATSGRWVGYLILGPILTVVPFPPANLLIFAGIAAAFGSILAVIVAGQGQRTGISRAGVAGSDAALPAATDLAAIRRNPLTRSIVSIALLSVPTLLVADYIFFDQAGGTLSGDSLQRLLSIVILLQGSAVLVGSFLGGAVVRRFGIGTGLMSVPVVVSILAVGLLVSLLVEAATVALVLAAAINIGEPMMRYGLRRPATALLYQPLAPSQALRVQSLVDGPGMAIMIAVTGIALIGLEILGSIAVIAATLVVIAATITVTFAARHRYIEALRSALERRQLGAGITFARETRSVLVAGLDDPDPGRVLAAARLIADVDLDALSDESDRLLRSPHPIVRAEALRWAERGLITPSGDSLRRIVVAGDLPLADRVLALDLGRRAGVEWIDAVVDELDRADTLDGAAVIRSVYPDRHREEMVAAAASPDREVRLRCAEILAETADSSDAPILVVLLGDDDEKIRAWATDASRRVDDDALWDVVFVPPAGIAEPVWSSLRKLTGEAAVVALVRRMGAASDENLPQLVRIALTCSDDRSRAAVERVASCPDPLIRELALTGLARIEHIVPDDREGSVRTDLHRIAAGCSDLIRNAGTMGGMLREAIDHSIERERRGLLSGIAILGLPAQANAVAAAFATGSSEQVDHANEWLRTAMPSRDRRIVDALEARPLETSTVSNFPPDLDTFGLDRWTSLLANQAAGGDSDVEIPLTERVIALRSAGMFASTPPAIVLELAEHATDYRLEDGDALFEQGDEGNELFVVIEGRIAIDIDSRRIDSLAPGSAFGELALLCGERRSASAFADGAALVIAINQQHFFQLLNDRPEVSISLLRYVADRLRRRTLAG